MTLSMELLFRESRRNEAERKEMAFLLSSVDPRHRDGWKTNIKQPQWELGVGWCSHSVQ